MCITCRELADRICCFNRHYAEPSGYFENLQKTTYLKDINREQEVTYYDSVTGKPLYVAPRGRSFAEFLKESRSHGWPSFRDEEVIWENVRCLRNGETISVDGTHVSSLLPDCFHFQWSPVRILSYSLLSYSLAYDSLVIICQIRKEIATALIWCQLLARQNKTIFTLWKLGSIWYCYCFSISLFRSIFYIKWLFSCPLT